MTAKRRLDRLEVGAGIGRAAWGLEAGRGCRYFGEAAKRKDPQASPAVRRVFADLRASYTPGAGAADLEAALDRALDRLACVLSPEAFGVGLAFCVSPDLLEDGEEKRA